MNFDTAEIQKIVIEKAVHSIVEESDIAETVRESVQKEVDRRVEKVFAATANKKLNEAIEQAIKDGFTRPFRGVNCFGEPEGAETSIKAQLVKQVDGYWNCMVDKRTGAPGASSYNGITRAEYLMTKICAEDFTKTMEQHAANITGALKDGLRGQMARQVDQMLDRLFKIKSLQDQGKVEKPF